MGSVRPTIAIEDRDKPLIGIGEHRVLPPITVARR